MRVLRFLRSGSAAAVAHKEDETDGLGAFSSESKTAARADADAGRGGRGAPRWLMAALMAALIIEAIPAGLFLSSRLFSEADPAVAPPSSPMFAPMIAGAPPCEPPAMAFANMDSTPAAPPAAAAPVVTSRALAGTLAVMAPVPMRVYEDGRLVGTTEAETIMLPVGTHDLEFVNDSVGYRTRRIVEVRAGRTSEIELEPPMGTIHVNALPWAEVWIDNQRVGETPIGNLRTRIGHRQVVFRHPQLGERRATVLVTLTAPARISMDLRSK